MRGYILEGAGGDRRLKLVDRPVQALGARDVRVRVRAVSLNYRDLLVWNDPNAAGPIPLSDGAGEIAEVGSDVTKWRLGDRVMPQFFSDWSDGPFDVAYRASALGGSTADGLLAEEIVLADHALVSIPDALTFEQAATLPCAGVTAWAGLTRARLRAGDVLLVQGTGGVSMFGLQIASALRARTIVLSSTPDKCSRAQSLGAWATVNYGTQPDWDVAVRALTEGRGVSHVLEVGGPETYQRSIASLAAQGAIVQVGVLSGFGPKPDLSSIAVLNARIVGVNVGSGADLSALADFIVAHQIEPIIDTIYDFEHASDAYAFMRGGHHFGKIVVRIG